MANASILAAFERMWQHIVTALNNKSDISLKVTGTGDIIVAVEDNTEYVYTNVTSLTMTGNEHQACGIVTFGSSPSIPVINGFVSDGDDITTATANETWEFNCYKGKIIWKNWGVV